MDILYYVVFIPGLVLAGLWHGSLAMRVLLGRRPVIESSLRSMRISRYVQGVLWAVALGILAVQGRWYWTALLLPLGMARVGRGAVPGFIVYG